MEPSCVVEKVGGVVPEVEGAREVVGAAGCEEVECRGAASVMGVSMDDAVPEADLEPVAFVTAGL